MDLSIVIPAFEESAKIGRDVQAALKFLQDNHLAGEIIVVDDGSQDNTAVAAKQAGETTPTPVKVIRYDKHQGKGFAVRTGINMTKGQFVMFADSGLCVPYDNTIVGLKLLKSGVCDIAHGSRKLEKSKIHRQQPYIRRVIGFMMRWILILWLKVPSALSDTQCGFKIYNGNVARKLYRQSKSDGFLFDIEIIMHAMALGYNMKEFPIEWTSDPDSRLLPIKNLWNTICEMSALKQLLRNLK